MESYEDELKSILKDDQIILKSPVIIIHNSNVTIIHKEDDCKQKQSSPAHKQRESK